MEKGGDESEGGGPRKHGVLWEIFLGNPLRILPAEYRRLKNKHFFLFLILFLVDFYIWRYGILYYTSSLFTEFLLTFTFAFISLAVLFKVIEVVERRKPPESLSQSGNETHK